MSTEQCSVKEQPFRVIAVTDTEVVMDTVTMMARDEESAKQTFIVEYAGVIKKAGSKGVRVLVRSFSKYI